MINQNAHLDPACADDGLVRHVANFKGSKRLMRMRELLACFTEHQTEVSVAALAEHLGRSASTIRRDLVELEERGVLRRTHGGARLAESIDEVPILLRGSDQGDAKALIARRAAALMTAGGPQSVGVNGGTTTLEVIRALRYRRDLTIVTNSLPIAIETATWPGVRTIITGGIVRARSLEATGNLAEAAFSSVNLATVFVGADGVSAQGGVTTHNYIEAKASAALVARARQVIVVADGSKVGRITLAPFMPAAAITDLVTDPSADPLELSQIETLGVRLHIVQTEATARSAPLRQ